MRNERNNSIILVKKDYRLLDKAWDFFSEYIGEKKMKTPLTIEEFDKILLESQDDNLLKMRDLILYSFQNECYIWPLVENKNKKRLDKK